MNILSITNTIKALFEKTRTAAPKIPPMLMAIGGVNRPGLSTQESVGKIVRALKKHGIPTGAAKDGSENKTVAVVIAIVEEIYRALHEDVNIQIALQPSALNIITYGTNEGGPMLSKGSNINFAEGTAIIQ